MRVWHHGDVHVPEIWDLQYWDGAQWQDVDSISHTIRWDMLSSQYHPGRSSTPTEDIFTPVHASKVRIGWDNCVTTLHGWIYEFEVFSTGEPVPDTTPPTLTVPADLSLPATSTAGTPVTYQATATDDTDPDPVVSCTPASGTLFPTGATDVQCTATDAAGNTASATFTVNVTYQWSGVLPPVNTDGTSRFKAGRTVPVKFALTGPSAPITDAVATLSYAELTGDVTGPFVDAETNVSATTGSQFRYADGEYIFNWSTKVLPAGDYLLKISLDDGVDRTVRVSLR